MAESLSKSKVKNRRSYAEKCGVALALDVVGERWTLLIVRNLLVGPQRFGELLEDLPGLTTNLLAQRLKQLREDGLLTREGDDARAPYALTERGRELEPVVFSLGAWGERLLGSVALDYSGNLRWLMLSLKRRYRGGLSIVVEIRDGARVFQLDLRAVEAHLHEGQIADPELLISGELPAVARLVALGEPLADVQASGLRLAVTGSKSELRRVQRTLRVDPEAS